MGLCRIPSDPEEAQGADNPYQALELRSHEVTQKAAEGILLRLTPSVPGMGRCGELCWGYQGRESPVCLGVPHSLPGNQPGMHTLLSLLVSTGAHFCPQDQVEVMP